MHEKHDFLRILQRICMHDTVTCVRMWSVHRFEETLMKKILKIFHSFYEKVSLVSNKVHTCIAMLRTAEVV